MALDGDALRHAAERIARTRDFGVGNRVSEYFYDERGRLTSSRLDMTGPNAIRPPTIHGYTAAGFLEKRAIPPTLSPAQREAIGEFAAEIEPLSWTADAGYGDLRGPRG